MDLDNLAQNNIYCEGWNFKQAKDKDSLFVTYDENSKVDIFKYKILWIMHIMFWDSAQKFGARFINSWGYQILPTSSKFILNFEIQRNTIEILLLFKRILLAKYNWIYSLIF